jgi:hypothetical protein
MKTFIIVIFWISSCLNTIFWKYLNIFLSFIYSLKEIFSNYLNIFLSYFKIQNQEEILSLNKLDETPLNIKFLNDNLNNTSEDISENYFSNIGFWLIILICFTGGIYLFYYFLKNNNISNVDDSLEKEPIFKNLHEIVKHSISKHQTDYKSVEINKDSPFKHITLSDGYTINCYEEQIWFFNKIYKAEIWPAFKKLDPFITIDKGAPIWNASIHYWFEEINNVDWFSLICQILHDLLNL